jgi:hypothetical protein
LKRKVLLIKPGIHEVGDYGNYYQPPMGLLKIGRYFKNKGIDVSYLDASMPLRLAGGGLNTKALYPDAPFTRYLPCGNYKNEKIAKAQRFYGMPQTDLRNSIADSKATEVWIGAGLTYYWEGVRDIASIVRQELPGAAILLGGIYPTLWPEHAVNNIDCDYVHKGPLDDIDDLMPDYDLDSTTSSIRTIQLGKGCNVNPPCSFCAVVAMDPKFKVLASDVVFKYMQEEYKKGGDFWQLWSSQLLVPPDRFKRLLKEIISSGMKIKMVASEGVQASLFTNEIAELMVKAGFISISVPMETISDDMNKEFRKPGNFNDYEKAVTCAQNAGFKRIKSFVMVGVPGQSYDEIVHAIVDCWARDTLPALHQYTPIPGSFDWNRFTQFHGVSPELLHPSLWPGASKDLTVMELEEIKGIAHLGLKMFHKHKSDKALHLVSHIWESFDKWCKIYGLIGQSGISDLRPLALKGYTSSYTDSLSSISATTHICQ